MTLFAHRRELVASSAESSRALGSAEGARNPLLHPHYQKISLGQVVAKGHTQTIQESENLLDSLVSSCAMITMRVHIAHVEIMNDSPHEREQNRNGIRRFLPSLLAPMVSCQLHLLVDMKPLQQLFDPRFCFIYIVQLLDQTVRTRG